MKILTISVLMSLLLCDALGQQSIGQERSKGNLIHRAQPVRPQEVRRLASMLDLHEGSVVADVGAGYGPLTLQLAPIVGESGKVIATEIKPDLVSAIRNEADSAGLSNVIAVLGTSTNSGLDQGCCDAVVLRMVYHQFDQPELMMADLYRSLRPGGLLAIIEWDRSSFSTRGYGPEGLAQRLSLTGFEQVEVVKGWIGNSPQYCVVFRRP